MLLDRRETLKAREEKRQARTLREWDYLLGVHDSCRMGALRFRRDAASPFLDNDRHLAAPPVASLRELEAASPALEAPDADMQPATPEGGAGGSSRFRGGIVRLLARSRNR